MRKDWVLGGPSSKLWTPVTISYMTSRIEFGEQTGISDPVPLSSDVQLYPNVYEDKDFTYILYGRQGGSDVGTMEDTLRDADHLQFGVPDVPDVIIDLGCNIGTTLVSYAAHFPEAKIIGVELDAENAAIARFNTKNHPNVEVIHAGVVGEKEFSPQVEYDRPSMGWNACRVQPGGSHTAPTTTLWEIVRSINIRSVVFVKMDIEGSEGGVVDDLSLAFLNPFQRDVRSAIIECHFPWSKEEIAEKMSRKFVVEDHPRHPQAVVGVRR